MCSVWFLNDKFWRCLPYVQNTDSTETPRASAVFFTRDAKIQQIQRLTILCAGAKKFWSRETSHSVEIWFKLNQECINCDEPVWVNE